MHLLSRAGTQQGSTLPASLIGFTSWVSPLRLWRAALSWGGRGLAVAVLLVWSGQVWAFAGDAQSAGVRNTTGNQPGWFAFDPPPDRFGDSVLDLRFLNERLAGEHGFVGVTNGNFIFASTGETVRFWGVNGPPPGLQGADLRRCARMLAKRGVNLVRVHGGVFDERGEVEPAKVKHVFEVVEAMKAEGIYTHLSIYFPLWLKPQPDNPWLKGYDGKTHPFAAIFFNPDFQAQYRKWWTALLTTPTSGTGKPLTEEPALASLEILNEDSFFFWTFDEKRIPETQLKLLEQMFGDWLAKKYGSLPAALAKWPHVKAKHDSPGEGRAGFRSLWNMFNEKTARDQDTVQFLLEVQTKFYAETYSFLRRLGFKGPITASNWATASPEVLGPLEKLSYMTGDFVDRHGYFGCNHKGESAEWSLRNGHTYSDRSALRFDPEEPGKPRQFVHPAMDPHCDGKPSMLSETTWNRPNRFRSEAPLYLAAYGALQHSDAIVHFALDGDRWAVKPNYWMQPWTLMSPAMVGQFPGAAFLFRQGLVNPGGVVAEIQLNREALLRLEGTPLPQDAALDELRLKDLPSGPEVKPGQRLDPLLHYVGRVEVRFASPAGTQSSAVSQMPVTKLINHTAQRVTSSTAELTLDYGKGVLLINAGRAQGVSGALQAAGPLETADLSIASAMELGHIVVVALDGQPLRNSHNMLLQVMSEEKTSGFQTEKAGEGVQRILNIGRDPWLVRELQGTVRFKRPDAAQLKIRALDFNGYPVGDRGSAREIQLQPTTLYYSISL
jgi:hypothetical protein